MRTRSCHKHPPTTVTSRGEVSMLRLFAKRGVRLAPFHTARQHPSRRTFFTGEVNESPEPSADQNGEVPGNAKPDRLWNHGSKNHLWERVEKLDDRVAGLAKDLGDFKGDVGNVIGELGRTMERGFGEMSTAIEKSRGDVKAEIGDLRAEIRPIVWQVRVLLGGASLVVVFLVKTYLEEHNIFTKKHPRAAPPVSRGPTQIVSSGPAGATHVAPKN
ncbi:hypothetical protein HOY80DRAFT_1072478 [Tuber brumale]|nr:hypothetical protein HOY80DRAFT_1072478 [Tuber brumale]